MRAMFFRCTAYKARVGAARKIPSKEGILWLTVKVMR